MKKPLFGRKKSTKGFVIEPEEIFLDSLNPLGFDESRHEGRIERSLAEVSSLYFFIPICLIILMLAGRMLYLQVVKGAYFYEKASAQSLLVSRIQPPRGQIIDDSSELLASNTTSFSVVFFGPEFKKGALSLRELLDNLSSVLDMPREDLIANGFPEDGQAIPQEIVILRNIDASTLIKIEAKKDLLPGVVTEEEYQRIYREGVAFSPLLGYIGALSKEEKESNASLPVDALIGKFGIERYYDTFLRGEFGRKIVQIDAARNIKKIKATEEPVMGETLKLGIDAKLQEKAFESLSLHLSQSGKRAGAVVILDPRNGLVKAVVSYPSFDNNLFSGKLSRENYENIFLNPDNPLFNRAVSGEYPPGSTIKPVIASGALEEGIIDPLKKIFSAGLIQIPNPFKPGEFSTFLDWKPLGWMDMRNALAFSSNVYFYTVGGGYGGQEGLGINRIKHYETVFGLGKRLGVDFPNEGDGFIPDPLWKARAKEENPLWRIGDTYNVSIGQGDTLVTPLQVASYTAVFANRGTLFQPRIVESISDPVTKEIVKEFKPVILNKDFLKPETIQIVREGMRLVVTNGTARSLGTLPVEVAGKTGTAETGRRNEAHAWFTAFAPYEDPEIVVTVLVEKGGEGSLVSAPIAKEILEWYFDPARQR